MANSSPHPNLFFLNTQCARLSLTFVSAGPPPQWGNLAARQLGSGRRGKAARACNLAAGSELRPFPVGSRLGEERARPLADGELEGRPQGQRMERKALGSWSRTWRPWEQRSHPVKNTPGRPSADLPTPPPAPHSRPVPVLPRVCSSGESRRPKRGGLACPRGPSLVAPSTTRETSGQPRTCISESSRAPLLAPDARGAGRRRASVRGGRTRRGEELVIACSGTMLTFEPLTTKQTTLVLSLHCPNRVY